MIKKMLPKNDWKWVTSLVVSTFAVIGTAVAFRLPPIIAFPLWIMLFGLLMFLFRSRRAEPAAQPEVSSNSRTAIARELMVSAEGFARRIRLASDDVDPEIAQGLRQVSRLADEVLVRLDKNPAILPSVQRLLTFYLPQAAEIADKYIAISDDKKLPSRQTKHVRATIQEIEGVFQHYVKALDDGKVDDLSIDLKVVNASAKADLRR